MKKVLIALVLLFSCLVSVCAQERYMVAGTVMDDKGEPLIGVTIIDRQKVLPGTITDLDGKFRVKDVPAGTVLTFTYVGYKKKEYKVAASKEQIKIVMEPDVSDLDEVVVTGQSSQRKVTITGAISVVKP